MNNPTQWLGEVCKKCHRRNCVGFNVSDDVWKSVAQERWNVLCATCFDEEAQRLGIEYEFGEVWPISWSDWKVDNA